MPDAGGLRKRDEEMRVRGMETGRELVTQTRELESQQAACALTRSRRVRTRTRRPRSMGPRRTHTRRQRVFPITILNRRTRDLPSEHEYNSEDSDDNDVEESTPRRAQRMTTKTGMTASLPHQFGRHDAYMHRCAV